METLIGYFGKYAVVEAGRLAGFQFEYLTTFGFAALVIFLGRFLVSKFKALQKYAIPAPVILGLVFPLVISGIKGAGIMEFTFDARVMKDLCQNLFSLCVGYGFSAKMLKNAGGKLCIMTAPAVCLLITLQNILGIALAHVTGTNLLLAFQCSSASMSGGVGAASVFGLISEKMGAANATTVGTAAGMPGNIMGPLIGGPVAAYLITSKGLKSDLNDEPEAQRIGEKPILDNTRMIHVLATHLPLAALGMPIYMLLDPIPMVEMSKFIGCLFAGVIGRDVTEAPGINTRMLETEAVEHMFPEFYLALVLITIDITRLIPVADQMGIILIVQATMMVIFAIFISFNLSDKDYGVAVMVAGNCGWGCGSGPNAVANEKAVTDQHGYHDIAWVLYPSFVVTINDIYNPIRLSLMGSLFGK